MQDSGKIHMIAFLLLIIGGINWLLVGLLNWDISDILGWQISRVVYILVGVAAIYELVSHKKCCKTCDSMMAGPKPMGQ
jgi:hypothetical protein